MPHNARFLAGASQPARLPTFPYPEIAFAGRSNVGKSSLLNRLVGQRRLARVSKTPGRTQQINFFLIDERVTFVDLPGYGFARVPLHVKDEWKRLIEAYLERRRRLRAVVVLVDLRRLLEDDDLMLVEFLKSHGIPCLVVATKADKLAFAARRRAVAALDELATRRRIEAIAVSANSGEGIDSLWSKIAALSSD
ncbi:MAG TPA: ribosome biogenesis GTP-binding protein YihA/YsxC [Candidatus Acidoferrales bacterium]|nr:ribosome biogenesis GTP-binding protein YihA/YsxC [Candidatus Acidoferrales bacterium]